MARTAWILASLGAFVGGALGCARNVEAIGDTTYSDPVDSPHEGDNVERTPEGTVPSGNTSSSSGNSDDRSRSGAMDAGSTALTILPPLPGEVLISEIMFDPTGSEPAGEWFELASRATVTRRLDGLTLKDGAGREHTIALAKLEIKPNQNLVFVRTRAAALTSQIPTAAIAYEYGASAAASEGIVLANGTSGGLALLDRSTVISSAPYGSWNPSASGRSIQRKRLDPGTTTSGAAWCISATRWASTDFGTPGSNNDCP